MLHQVKPGPRGAQNYTLDVQFSGSALCPHLKVREGPVSCLRGERLAVQRGGHRPRDPAGRLLNCRQDKPQRRPPGKGLAMHPLGTLSQSHFPLSRECILEEQKARKGVLDCPFRPAASSRCLCSSWNVTEKQHQGHGP